jgi:ATP-dependent Zn protease
MTEQYPLGTAYHEAGHAVVASCLGLRVGDIHINAEDEGGGAKIAGADRLSIVDQVALCFAGMAAQNIWKQRSAHLIGGKDYEKFFELAVGLSEGHRDALRVAGYQRANQLLIAHKAKIEAILEHLAEHGHLSASEFASLML